MIIDSLIHNYHQEEAFQKNFCIAVEYIAKIKDFLEKDTTPFLQNFNYSLKESHFRASILRKDFCYEVTNSKIYLKQTILKHLWRFIRNFLGKDQTNKTKPDLRLRREIIDILKEFLKHTYSEVIITKVSIFLENLRPIWKENWYNGNLDLEIEESTYK